MKQSLDIKKMMTIDLERMKLGMNPKILAKKRLKMFLTNAFKKWYDLRIIPGQNSMLFFYGRWNWRHDHYKTFITFTSKFKSTTRIYYEKKESPRYTLFNGIWWLIKGFLYVFANLVRGTGLASSIIKLPYYQTIHEIKEIYKKTRNYYFLVLYYDIAPDENCLLQLFNGSCKKTATLQHGIFSEKNIKKELADTALEYKYSESNYYLAWNKYTMEQAIKSGMEQNKIRVLGIPRYIDTDSRVDLFDKSGKTFGVILNNSDFDEHNKMLIRMANEISARTGLKYIARFHPQMKGNEYDSLFNSNCIKKGLDKSSIADYAKTVLFTIISSSSVFVDLIYLGHPVYRLALTDFDTYSEVKEYSFKTIDEILSYLKEPYDSATVFDYLCTTRDIYNSYKNFFETILKGENNENNRCNTSKV